jgi:hypothetical protein
MLTPDYSLQKIITSGEDAQREDRLLSTQALEMGARAVSSLDEGWDEARRAWNLAVDQNPSLVVFPETTEEVVALTRFALENGLRLAPQGTGHGAGPLGSLRDVVLVRTSRLASVAIDVGRMRAKVGAGVTWGRVEEAAAYHGLTGLVGSSPDVGVVGYSLGGGLGWFARRYGLACNSVLSLEVVTPDGRVLHVDRDHEPDLFWALRGGGGSFAIVTAMELELYRVESVYAGTLFWPQERAAEVLRAWTAWTRTIPDTITSVGRLLNLPDMEAIPPKLRGRSFVSIEAACLSSEPDTAALLRPLRDLSPEIDTFRTMAPADLHTLHMDPSTPVPAYIDGWLLSDLPDAGIDVLLGAAGLGSGSPLLSVEFRQLGGALATGSADHGALDTLEAAFAVATVSPIPDPATAAAVGRGADAIRAALSQWEAEHNYRNFAERARSVSDFHGAATMARLRSVQARYDKLGMIRSTHPVRAE